MNYDFWGLSYNSVIVFNVLTIIKRNENFMYLFNIRKLLFLYLYYSYNHKCKHNINTESLNKIKLIHLVYYAFCGYLNNLYRTLGYVYGYHISEKTIIK